MRKTLIAGAILSAFSLLPSAAYAHPHVEAYYYGAVVVGTGTISPGLPQSGCAFQSVSFSGTAVVGGVDAQIPDPPALPTVDPTAAAVNVTFNGNSDICETLATGHGSGTVSGGVTGSVTYSRTENVVTLSGSVSIDGRPSRPILVGVCVFTPTSAPPVTSYALVCVVATADAEVTP